MSQNEEIIARVVEIYNWIEELQASSNIAGKCDGCGKCCDFESFGHKLFVTPPEMIYFAEKTGKDNIKQMTTSRCPYQDDKKCTIRDFRFAACRIFCCKGMAMFQSELTEAAIKKLKDVCREFKLPYKYVELKAALLSV